MADIDASALHHGRIRWSVLARPGWARRIAALAALMLLLGGLFICDAAYGTVSAQQAQPSAPPNKMPMDAALRVMETDPRMQAMQPNQRMSVLEFVAGNLVFVLQHEMGHAQISERRLPVLGGRDEDAADVFAALTMLQMGDMMSERVLEQAAMGWFLSARRDERTGQMPEYYAAHGLDRQRAYQIVCLMVGSDKEKFRRLAVESKLPKERWDSCGADFRFAARSWDDILAPHRRTADQPKAEASIVYGEAKGRLKVYADTAKAARLLENLAAFATEEFTWTAPLTVQMVSCGEANANWNPFTRKVTLCYEMADELAGLYARYGSDMKPAPRKKRR